MSPTVNPENKPTQKSDVILEYIKAVAWPGLALLVFIVFWGPLHQIANMAPSLLNRSDSIKIGSVTLVLGKDVIVEIPDEVRQVIRTLTPDELDDLLAVQGSGTFTAESLESPQVETWRRWVSLGLLTEMSQSELETYRKTSLENKNAVVGFRSTPLLYSARKSLIDLLPQILRKAEREAARRNEGK